ncbi:MAG: PHB depolymerase family esterase, partial [Pseudomonadota bacterium]|nr:PHB depolymerase family esterase [Pseudomonadota bacterium]
MAGSQRMFKQFSRLWLKSVKQLVKPPAARRAKVATAAPTKRKVVIPKTAAVHVAASAQWRRHTYVASAVDTLAGVTAGRRMDYWLFQPGTSASEPLPLLVMLHGCGQSAVEFASGTRMNRLAESQGFAVLYPQQAQSAQRQRCWPWYRKEIQDGGGEARMITAIMRKVVAQHGFDPARVYCAGLSAGAAMAHIIALRYPQLVAAVALHSGPMFGAAHSSVSGYGVMQHGSMHAPEKMLPLSNADDGDHRIAMPALLIHGRQDTVVRVVNLQQLE